MERIYKQSFLFLRCPLFHITIILSNEHKINIFKSIQYTISIYYVLPIQENSKAPFQQKFRKRKVNIFVFRSYFFFSLAGSFLDVKGNKEMKGGKNKTVIFFMKLQGQIQLTQFLFQNEIKNKRFVYILFFYFEMESEIYRQNETYISNRNSIFILYFHYYDIKLELAPNLSGLFVL